MLKRMSIAFVILVMIFFHTNRKVDRINLSIQEDVPLQAIVEEFEEEAEKAVENEAIALETSSRTIDVTDTTEEDRVVTEVLPTTVLENQDLSTVEPHSVSGLEESVQTPALIDQTEVAESDPVTQVTSLTPSQASINSTEMAQAVAIRPSTQVLQSKSDKEALSHHKKKEAPAPVVKARVTKSYDEICDHYNAMIKDLQSSAEATLRAIANQAVTEYKAMSSQDKNNYERRMTFVNKYFAIGNNLESSFDDQLASILYDYSQDLKTGGYHTDIITEVQETYKLKKEEMRNILMTEMIESLTQMLH